MCTLTNHWTQMWYTTKHRRVLIIFFLILQTVSLKARVLCTKSSHSKLHKNCQNAANYKHSNGLTGLAHLTLFPKWTQILNFNFKKIPRKKI